MKLTNLLAALLAMFTITATSAQEVLKASHSQKPIKWDDTEKTNWSGEFEVVDIPSSADGKMQKAYFYKTKSKKMQPLIVSLHTWSGDYTQKDPLTAEIIARGYNYIHPDFRGANNKPEACGSALVISDIEDAIRYAVANSNTDPDNVHVIGVSGGGMATLLAYMTVKYPVRSFSAWAPISNLEDWYWESVGRGQKYAQDILKSVSPDTVFRAAEALKRSPITQAFPKEMREGANLYIYEGVHDGYTGSVPITHSIDMYNRLVGDLKYGETDPGKLLLRSDSDLVSAAETIGLVTKRCNPSADPDQKINGRSVYLHKKYGDISLTIFEGGHEQLPQALSLLPFENQTSDLALKIFTIGDSNGNNPGGWVDQLKAAMPASDVFNLSQGGRTIGFDNGGREELNALRNVDSYMERARKSIGNKKYDYIIVCLGTNDTKAEFDALQDEVVVNFNALLDRIVKNRLTKRSEPKLIFVTPPPMGVGGMQLKYDGGNDRLKVLVPKLMKIAGDHGFSVIDIYHPLQQVFRTYAEDGVHMSPEGQVIVAQKVVECIEALEAEKAAGH